MRHLTSIALLLALSLAACTRDATEYGRCETIFDCRATGQACVDGYCAAGALIPAAAYGIELTPATNVASGPVRNELPEVALDGSDVALEFQPPVELSGRVILYAQAATAESISATITVSRRSQMGLSRSSYTVEAASGRGMGDSAFSLRLPPTRTARDEDCDLPGHDCYELHVVPAELDLWAPILKRRALPESRAIDQELASAMDLRVTGYVKDAALLNGLGGLEVRVVDGAGRTVSSVYTTSADADRTGFFQLSLSRDTVVDQYWLQIAESTASPDVPRFLYAFDPAEADTSGNLGLGDVALLDFQWPVAVSYRVKGPASNGKQEPIEGAQVRFTTYLRSAFTADSPAGCPTDKCAVYTRQGTTDANGEVELKLIPAGPAGYEVEILPGPNSPYSALRVGGVEVDQPGVGADFALVRKLEVRGTVVDSLGLPVAGASVTATPRGVVVTDGAVGDNGSPSTIREQDVALDELPSSKQSDDAGQFLLSLEPGVSYDLVVTPPASSPNPVVSLTGQAFERAANLSIQLPEAALLVGSVSSFDGQVAAGSLVRVYEVLLDPDTGEKTAWLRGEGVSQADGTFKLLLPAGAASVQ